MSSHTPPAPPPANYNTFGGQGTLGHRRAAQSSGFLDMLSDQSSGDDYYEPDSPRRPRAQKGRLRPQKYQLERRTPLSRKASTKSGGSPSHPITPCEVVDAATGEYTFEVSGHSWGLTALSIPFYAVVQLRWAKLLLLCMLLYLSINLFFATMQYLPCALGVEWKWLSKSDAMATHRCQFWLAYEFSVETISTIGFGELKPKGSYARFFVCAEAMSATLLLPCITAIILNKLLVSRRLRHTVVFSQFAVVNSYNISNEKGTPCLFFRVASLLKHPPADVKLNVFLMQDLSPDPMFPNIEVKELAWRPTFCKGSPANKGYAALPIPYLSIPATVYHEMDEDSPLHGFNYHDMVRSNSEIVVVLEAMDDSTGATVSVKQGYGPKNLCFDAVFDPSLLTRNPETGSYRVDLTAFDTTLAVPAPRGNAFQDSFMAF